MPNLTGRRAIRDGLAVAGLIFAGYLFALVAPQERTVGFDAYAYWSVDGVDPYRRLAGALGAFPYTPVAALAAAPFSMLEWWQFLWLWEALLVGTLIWLGGRRSLYLLAFPPVALELYHGNVHLLIAAAIALGWRHPWTWSFVLLTKLTPGVGLLWFAIRREWRCLGIALGITTLLVVASLVAGLALGRDLWGGWIGSLQATYAHDPAQSHVPIPLAVRLAASVTLVTWGARSERPWTVPLASCLALPILWPTGFAVLAALLRLGGGTSIATTRALDGR